MQLACFGDTAQLEISGNPMEPDADILPQLQRLLDRDSLTISPMQGATSSDLFLISDGNQRWVLRQFKPERWESTTSELSAREALILKSLDSTPLPTPTLIATLPENGVLMSYLPGEVSLPRQADGSWLDTLAQRLVEIHQTPLELPFKYQSWNDVQNAPAPDWWGDAELWQACQQKTAQQPVYGPVLVHRDYHPVNVLWQNNAISGIVDWINACSGPAGIDVAHCRLNLAIMYDVDAANDFLRAYLSRAPDYRHDPYWDIDDALGVLPDVQPYAPWVSFGMDPMTTAQVRARLLAYVRQVLG